MVDCDRRFGLHARGAILFLLIIPLTNAQPLSFDYPNSHHDLILEGDATIPLSSDGIQLTKIIADGKSNWTGSIGRVTYPEQLHLWDNSSKELKNFTTSFSFVLSNQIRRGEGLAFFLASPDLPNTNDKAELKGGGLGLGLVDANQTLLRMTYKFVAVEFDTFSNIWDPDGAHVGVNINNMSSDILEQWSIPVSGSKVYDCSIGYNSRNHNLDVSFTGYRTHGDSVTRTTQYLSYHINLTEHLPEWVIVGISATTGEYIEEHTLLSWSFSTSLQSNHNPKKHLMLKGVAIGIGLSVSFSVLVHILLWKVNKGKEEKPTSETASDLNMDVEFQMGTGPKKIGYHDLVTSTDNFDDVQKIGQGGFGGVYKGYLKDSNSYAAIKRISTDSRQGIKEYAAEVKIISQLRHKNLVKLNGWCHKKNDLLLIYEYMPNGSLDSHLFDRESILSWQVRYNIALDLALALLYLQEGWEKCVLHRDIKSSNIMLDSNFKAKLGDFGLARLVDHEKGSKTTVMAGTMGYLAPEYINTGKATKESDIFSLGVVLLEIATGRKAIHHKDMAGQVSLVEWVWELYGLRNLLAAADPKLGGVFDVQQMECLLAVGLWCTTSDRTSRPSIRQVMKALNFEDPLPILPQSMPVLAYLPPTTDELFFTAPSSFLLTS